MAGGPTCPLQPKLPTWQLLFNSKHQSITLYRGVKLVLTLASQENPASIRWREHCLGSERLISLSDGFQKLQLRGSEHPKIKEASPPNFPWTLINLKASTILVWCLHQCSLCLGPFQCSLAYGPASCLQWGPFVPPPPCLTTV